MKPVLDNILEKLALFFEFTHYGVQTNSSIESNEDFINQLRSTIEKKGIVLIENEVTANQIKEFEKKSTTPFMFLDGSGEGYFFLPNKKNKVSKAFKITTEGLVQIDNIFEKLNSTSGMVQLFTFFPVEAIAEENNSTEKLSPFKRLISMLRIERRDILSIYVYAILIGTISLALPLGIQAIIGFVQGGVYFSSIYILIGLVILALVLSGVMQVMQLTIVEFLQERLFIKSAFEYTYRITNIKTEALRNYYPPELMNRFFDIITVQKTLPKILIDVTAALIQIIFGLLLLSAYHPLFIGFALLTVLIIFLVIRIYGKRLLDANMVKSKYKFKIAYWLQDMARMTAVFKIAGGRNFPMQKMEQLSGSYLKYRKKYFNYLLILFYNAVFFKALVVGGLLILGTYLVVNLQITIGQFVASEIVVVLVVSSVEKILLSFDSIFDLLTAVDKLGHVSDLPLENHKGILRHLENKQQGIGIELKGLKYKFADSSDFVLNNINLKVKPSEKIAISGINGSGKETFLKVLAGILGDYQGLIAYDGISIRDIQQEHFFLYVKKNQTVDAIFDGTILENITLNRPHINDQDLREILEGLQLNEGIGKLKDGLQTQILSGGRRFSDSFKTKLILARCLLSQPRLLILSNCFDSFNKQELDAISSFILSRSKPTTVLIETKKESIMEQCDKIILMDKGQIIQEGTFSELKKDSSFQNYLY
ncbi:ABC transporter related protein [Emticicia oligotrophica DSM 17448]|uniref:ABC transporter related protein n=1 Tax=Emticicia oligotrophica (strain DSM 17448 / CIP 109782 / MTCC 6937 / GPTSA100-15) TaxID=929562 RepID=A0ABN4AM78_EMTOG|nr:ATP-binding cassette domain-containing protein [Emticicia oligotrophica]AFK03247.1 ABC transporter related protein [Emticicia oligotrophica DSM 17448]